MQLSTSNYSPLGNLSKLNRGLITGNRSSYFSSKRLSSAYVSIIAGTNVHRYSTDRPSDFVLFKRPDSAGGSWDTDVHFAPHKIVIRQIGKKPMASIVHEPIAVTGNIFTIRLDTLEQEIYILGILNSRLIAFFWRTVFSDFKDSFPQVTIFSLSQVPIKMLNLSNSADKARHNRMVTLVERMLALHKQLAAATGEHDRTLIERQIAATDKQIDQLVYELYELTDEEIRIVEEASHA